MVTEELETHLLGSITQEPPFRYVDRVLALDSAMIEGEVRYALGDHRCTAERLDGWLCVEMLAQLAEIHTRWLTQAKRANGLLVGADGFEFDGASGVEAGLLTLKAERLGLLGTFLQYRGEVLASGVPVARGTLTIYNVGHE